MKRPTAADRRLADYFRQLPKGQHTVFIEVVDGTPVLKAEGGMIVGLENGMRLVVVPGG